MFRSGNLTRNWKRLRRPQFTSIPRDANNPRGYAKIAETILAHSDEVQAFTLEPNAWMEAFGFRCPEEQHKINERIIERVRIIEERAERQRAMKNVRVMGRERLISQVFNTTYRSKREGRRTSCLSEKRSVRIRFIKFFRELMGKARAVRQRWKMGDVTVPYPPGLYPPSMPRLANDIGL